VHLMWVTMDGSITEMLSDRHVRVDRYVATGTANDAELNESRQMLVSPDGSTLAFLTVTGSNAQTLWLLDLSTPGTQPVMIQEQGIGENVWHYIWSASNRLYYAAGTVETDSLYVVTPDGSSSRIERGRFFRIGTSYTGDKIAVAEWFANPDSLGDDLFQLKLYDTNGNNFILKQGTAEEHNKMIPLAVQ
jgi:Tol biopolymer transport system component